MVGGKDHRRASVSVARGSWAGAERREHGVNRPDVTANIADGDGSPGRKVYNKQAVTLLRQL